MPHLISNLKERKKKIYLLLVKIKVEILIIFSHVNLILGQIIEKLSKIIIMINQKIKKKKN